MSLLKLSKLQEEGRKKLSFEDIFKTEEQLKEESGLLRVGIYGPPGSGKTHFAMTFPEPIYFFDTEFSAKKLYLKKFKNKKIYIAEVFELDPQTDEPDALKSLEMVEDAIRVLADMDIEFGTIVIDSVTDIWDWYQVKLKKHVKKLNARGEPYQFDYKHANKWYRDLIGRILAKPVHVVLTAHEKEEYDSSGNPTGNKIPQWNKKTPYWMDIVIKLKLETEFDPRTKKVKRHYRAYLEKLRQERYVNPYLCEDITFDKLADILEKKYGVYVKRKP